VGVAHRFDPSVPHLLRDVAYDVDTSSSYDAAALRVLVEGAQADADALNAPFASPEDRFPRYERFHSWPNLIHLTALREADPDLYDRVVVEILARDPEGASFRAQADAHVARGDRVLLARDYVDAVSLGAATFHEVHYALWLNLDARYAVELLAHAYALDGLPRPADPHVDALRALLGAGPGPGQTETVWSLCLRGNHHRWREEAFLVDRVEGETEFLFHVGRIAPCGSSTVDRGVHGDVPWIPWEPPHEDVPPPPSGGNPPPVIVPGLIPVLHPPGQAFTRPPLVPWPFPGPEAPPPAPDPTVPSEPPAPTSGGGPCEEDAVAVADALAAAEAEWEALAAEREATRDALRAFAWGWVEGATFADPCVQALYDALSAQAAALAAERDAKEAELEALLDDWEASREARGDVADSIRHADSLWSNMIEVGGEWSQVRAPCIPPAIPGGGFQEPVILTTGEIVDVQRCLFYALMNGTPWAEAVDRAIADDAARRRREGFVSDALLAIYATAWRTYLVCLRGLVAEQLRIFLPTREGLDDATADEIEEIVEWMLDRDPSALPPDVQAERAAGEAADAAFSAEADALRAERTDLEARLRALALAFQEQARDDCLGASLEALDRLRTRIFLYRAFPRHCADPSDPEALPLVGAYFCEEIDALLSDPAHAGHAAFRAWLQSLRDANC
jgi:hypothetical protein